MVALLLTLLVGTTLIKRSQYSTYMYNAQNDNADAQNTIKNRQVIITANKVQFNTCSHVKLAI